MVESISKRKYTVEEAAAAEVCYNQQAVRIIESLRRLASSFEDMLAEQLDCNRLEEADWLRGSLNLVQLDLEIARNHAVIYEGYVAQSDSDREARERTNPEHPVQLANGCKTACDRCGEPFRERDEVAEIMGGLIVHVDCMLEGEEVA